MIRAAEGGTIALDDGTAISIPPGALERDTVITIRSVPESGPSGLRLGALVLEPAGLVFAQPATARFPLPADWDPEEAPVVYYAVGSDPTEAMPSGEVAALMGSAGAYFSEHPVHHSSCTVAAQNCHAGTIKHIVGAMEARGVSHAALLESVRRCFPAVKVDESDCGSAGPNEVQAVLDTFFDDRGGWDPGAAMPADVLAGALQSARDGRLVVLAFSIAPWQPRGGPHKFYPANLYAHTAPLRVQGGQVVIHNTIMNDNQKLRAIFGGEVTATWPAERLEEFRSLQVGVALEMQLCGQPDCLSAPDRNPHGLDVYSPLNGISSVFAGSSVGPRPVAWPAVRLYVERPAGSEGANAVCPPPATPPGGGSCGERPNGECAVDGATYFVAKPCAIPASDVEGRKNWCCPADLCRHAGECVQLKCPAECYRMACRGCAFGYGGCWCSPFPAMDFTCHCEAGDFRITGSSPTPVQPPPCP